VCDFSALWAVDTPQYLTWTREEVAAWLRDCVCEFDLKSDLPEKFDMNGKYAGFGKIL
jgi:Sterile alpha motif (SAM)/Pointed domain